MFDPRASTVHMRVDPTLLQLRRKREKQTGTLTQGRVVSLLIRGISERLAFEEGTEIVLGRIDFTNPDLSRLDLTRYGGHERGVSREHALLRFQESQLTVTDLHSVNGTMVNLVRIEANQPVTLKDGDELMLGTLLIKLRFDFPPDAMQRPATPTAQPAVQPAPEGNKEAPPQTDKEESPGATPRSTPPTAPPTVQPPPAANPEVSSGADPAQRPATPRAQPTRQAPPEGNKGILPGSGLTRCLTPPPPQPTVQPSPEGKKEVSPSAEQAPRSTTPTVQPPPAANTDSASGADPAQRPEQDGTDRERASGS